MDSLTHIVVGACVGELIAGKKSGKKALVLGAIANSLPDIDTVASVWLNTTQDLLAHRGFTHSILFVLLITPILSVISQKVFAKSSMALNKWMLFWGIEIFLHLFIDSFNSYGTGLFEPFSHYRVSFNSMFVADPLFTIWPIIAFVLLLIWRKGHDKRRIVAKAAIILAASYLVLGVCFKLYINGKTEKSFALNNIKYKSYFTTPTPLNNMLWYVVAGNDSGYYIGYRSLFDKGEGLQYHYTSKNDGLLKSYANDDDAKRLIRFSKGYYTAALWHDTLVFNDIRFGEVAGWAEPNPRFIFYYFLQHPSDNDMIVQRGRFAKWDKQQLFSFMNRIKGI